MKRLLTLILLPLAFQTNAQSTFDSVAYFVEKANGNQYRSFDSMFYYANRILNLGERTDDALATGKYHAIVGVALEEMGKYDSAIYHQNEALQIGKQENDLDLISVAYQHLGVINKDLGNYEDALEYFIQAEQLAPIGKYYTVAMSVLGMAQINYRLGKYQEALTLLARCQAIGKKNDDTTVMSAALIESGNNRTMLGDLDGAIVDFKEAASLKRASKNQDGLISIINNIGAVYFYKGDFSKAIAYYESAKKESITFDDPISLGIAYQNIGEAYIYLKEYDKSEESLLTGLDILKKLGNKGFVVSNYQYLHDLEQARGDFESALMYFKLKDVYEDSILNERNLARISDLKIQYETEKKEQQVALLETEKQLQEAKLEESRIVILLISILSIVVVIAVVLFNSRKRYKLKEALAVEKEQLQRNRFKAVIDAEENERKRIARELHDGLGQLLSTARINISGVADANDKKVKNSISLIDQSIDEVRTISHNLMPNALVAIGLKPALAELARKVSTSGTVEVKLDVDGALTFEEPKTISIYRIVQEVVNNALKYSDSPIISIRIQVEAVQTTFHIADEGTGFDAGLIEQSEGIGWANIYSRVDLIGGEINIYSKLGAGTTVKITIPNDGTYDQTAVG